MTIYKFLIFLFLILEQFYTCEGTPPPVRNFTTITLFTDLKTWNEATQICADQGGEILDITYFSLFSIMLTFASVSPWKDLPVGNGPLTWIGLHRRVTPLGDTFYSHNCQKLSDFKVAYWNTSSPYTIMDGDVTSFCTYHQVLVSTSEKGTTYKHDYTRAGCDEQHQFFCISQNGPCDFEKIDGYYGNSSRDFTPNNDVIFPYESDEKCAELCLNSWSVFAHPDIRVVEECWGFSTSGTECRLHNVVKPSYLDKSSNRIASASRKLFIKRCFASAVNNNVFDVPEDASIEPNTTCGTPVLGNSTATSLQVFVYLAVWTWNEAFSTCNQSGLELLQIQREDDYTAIQQLVNKYTEIQSMDYIWLGLHEPDPINHTDIRVWTNCGASVSSNWDPASPPSSNITDASLCVVLDTSSNYWYRVMCNEQHYFICTGEYGTNNSFTNGVEISDEEEVSLGPYEVSASSCEDMCSTITYEDQECWGYAVLEADTDDIDVDDATECFLYFVNISNPHTDGELSSENYILFTKLIWSDTLLHRSGDTDNSLIPKSCCDVSGIKSECPVNNLPLYSESVPTTEKLNLLLYTTAVTWNEALTVCKGVGGTLLQPDDASKQHMLQRYIDTWITNGYLSGDVWIGLSQLHSDDPCSLRWTSNCTRPTWTDFVDASYTEFSTNHCIAINNDVKFVKKPCDEKLQFVCEINAGPCDILEVVSGTSCTLGALGASLTVPSTTCLADCHAMTYNNMECWAVVKSAPNTCHLIFYADPEYCKENNFVERQYNVSFKTCYTATVSEIPPFVSMGVSIFPMTSCLHSIPAETVCDTTSTAAIPPSTTLSSSSLSQPSTTAIPPSTTQSSSPVSQSLTTAVPPSTTLSSSSASQSSTTAIPPSTTLSPSSVSQSSTTAIPPSTTPSSSSLSQPSTTAIPPSTTLFSSSVSQSSTTAIPPSTTLSSSSVSQSSTTAIPPSTTLSSSSVSQSPTTAIPPSTTLSSSSVSQSSTTSEWSSTTQPSTATPDFVTNITVSLTPMSTSSITSPYPVSTTQLSTLTTKAILNATSVSIQTTHISLPTTTKLFTNFTNFSVKPIYISPCLCYTENKTNLTTEEWHEWFVLANTIPKQNTSRYNRKLTSVKDQRTSSLTIGITVSLVLVALALYVIITDMPRISRSVSYIHGINSKKNRTARKYEIDFDKAKTAV